MIVKSLLEQWNGMVWTDLMLLRIGTSSVCYEHGDEPSGSKKMLGKSRGAQRLVAFYEGISLAELIT
jgi:hypothetical protein